MASAPSVWVVRFADRIRPGGTVLDLACGAGRHTRFFLGRGHAVVAVDRDVSGLADLEESAALKRVRADLEAGGPWPLGTREFAGVVVTNYLHRPILPCVVGAVAPAGILIYETFAVGNARFGRPSNPDFLLQPGELLAAVQGRLDMVAYENREVRSPRPGVIQRIAAVRAA